MEQTPQGPPEYLEKKTSIRVYASYGDTNAKYPYMLGEGTFGLQHFIGKKGDRIKVPLLLHNDKKGSVKVEVSIVSEDEVKKSGHDNVKFFETMSVGRQRKNTIMSSDLGSRPQGMSGEGLELDEIAEDPAEETKEQRLTSEETEQYLQRWKQAHAAPI